MELFKIFESRGTKGQAIQIGNKTFFLSYGTCIAFRNAGKLFISKNYWRNVTGGHLNCISNDKSIRMNADDFSKALKEIENKISEV